jgi:hypothetical protein
MNILKLKIFLLCLTVSFSYAKDDVTDRFTYTLIKKENLESERLAPKSNELLTHYQWLQLKDLPQDYYNLFNIDHTTPKDSVIMLVKSSFLIKNTISNYNDNYFRESKNLGKLSGMEYNQTGSSSFDIEFSPFPFYNIEAKAEVLTSHNNQDYEFLNIVKEDSFLVHLKSFAFTSDLYQSDIIGAFTMEGDLTRVDSVSFALLTDNELDSFFMNRKKSIMISKLKEQLKVMLLMYSK